MRTGCLLRMISLLLLSLGVSSPAFAQGSVTVSQNPPSPQQFTQMFLEMGKTSAPACADAPVAPKKKKSFDLQIATIMTYAPPGHPLESTTQSSPMSIDPYSAYMDLNYTASDRTSGKSIASAVNAAMTNTASPASAKLAFTAAALIKGMGTFYSPSMTPDQKQQASQQASAWATSQIKQMNFNDADALSVIGTVLDDFYGNYNNARNPGQGGGTNDTRSLNQMASGYNQQMTSANPWATNANGGVCDDIAAAGCQMYNQYHNYKSNDPKACKLVGIQSAGEQHWVVRIPQGNDTYLLLDGGTKQLIHGEGNSISSVGNPSLKIPVMIVGDDGKATIVDFEDGELQKFINAFTGNEETLVKNSSSDFQGQMAALRAAFTLTGLKGINRITVGAADGKLSLQNEGADVYGVFLKVEDASNLEEATKNLEGTFKAKFGAENKLTVSYAHMAETATSTTPASGNKTVELNERFAGIYVQQLGPIRVELKAGADLTVGAILPDQAQKNESVLESTGFSGGGNFFETTTVSGEKKINANSAISGKVAFTVSGIPGIVLSELHGLGNGGSINGDNIKGFYAHDDVSGSLNYKINSKNSVGLFADYSHTPASGQYFTSGTSYSYTNGNITSTTTGSFKWSPDSPLFTGEQLGVKEQVDFSLTGKRGQHYVLSPNAFANLNLPSGNDPSLGLTGMGLIFGFGK